MNDPDEVTHDLAAMTASLYHRCVDELALPPLLAEQMASDFYTAIMQRIVAEAWQGSPRFWRQLQECLRDLLGD